MVMLVGLMLLFWPVCPSPEADALNSAGCERASVFDFVQAAGFFERAVQTDPGCRALRLNLVSALLHAGRLDEAHREIEQLKNETGRDPQYDYLYGMLLLREGREPEAVDHFRAVLSVDPADADSFCQLGLIEFHRGALEAAVRYFEEALEQDAEHATALYNEARALKALGRDARSKELMERFKALKAIQKPTTAGGMGEPYRIPGKYASLHCGG